MSEESVYITLVPSSRSSRMCDFIIDTGDWVEVVRMNSKKSWICDLFLKAIYRFGRVESAKQSGDRLYPPIITFSFPRDKVRALSALRFVKAKDRDKLERLFEQSYEEFEREAIALGVAESLGKRD